MADDTMEYWEVWYPAAAATGLLLGRCQIEPTDTILVHAVPNEITVEISDANGARLAYGAGLKRTLPSPICRLQRRGASITREDIWPSSADIGRVVMLPGGEAATLISWWHAPDRLEWRWQIELYNSRR